MREISCDLVIQLDENKNRFVFRIIKKNGKYSNETENFLVELDIDELKKKGPEDAEKLIGSCVLGFFDKLTNGRLDLPKHYEQ